jgi:hypothetical protein
MGLLFFDQQRPQGRIGFAPNSGPQARRYSIPPLARNFSSQ